MLETCWINMLVKDRLGRAQTLLMRAILSTKAVNRAPRLEGGPALPRQSVRQNSAKSLILDGP
jgi:hypothetical protein